MDRGITHGLRDGFWYWVIDTMSCTQAAIYFHVLKRPVWRSFDGRVTPMDEMNDGHLRNSIRMMIRKGQDGDIVFKRLTEEADRRRLFW
jgi:hypothetical protein